MDATRLPIRPDNTYVRLNLGRGILLLLTHEEYKRGLYRGKMARRTARNAARTTEDQTRQESQRLDWITD